MVKIVKAMIALAACLLLGLLIMDHISAYRLGYRAELENTVTSSGEKVEVTIPEDASDLTIAHILRKKGLIKYELAFVERLHDSDYKGTLQGGTYELNTGMTTLDMMKAMSSLSVVRKENTIQLVVPEGFTVDQIAARCDKLGICNSSDFISEVKSVTRSDYDFIQGVEFDTDVRYKVEGFMFPATYDIPEDMSAKGVVEYMLTTFMNYYTDDMRAKAQEKGLTTYQVITLASILERECKIENERETIAGIYYNRMNAGMALEVDSTLLYSITEGRYDKTDISDTQRSTDNGYNTYTRTGLPSGPICNPGVACIKAVLSPEDSSYLYYKLSDGEDGSHTFSETPFDSGEESGDGE